MIWKPIVYTGFSAVIGSWKITAIWLPRTGMSSLCGMPRNSRPSSLHRTGDLRVGRKQPEQRHRARALARAGLADDGQHLAALDRVVEVDRRGIEGAIHPEVDTEVGDLENGLRGCGCCWGSLGCLSGSVCEARCMRFAPTVFRPAFGRVLSVMVVAHRRMPAWSGFVVAGDWPVSFATAGRSLLLAAVALALFWFPRLAVAEHEVTVRNVFSTVHVPWPAITLVDTKWALTLHTADGMVSVWASPAPNRYASQSATERRRDARGARLRAATR